MSSFSSAFKIHVSPSSREHPSDSVGQILTDDQGQILDAELGLMGMIEDEYSHVQHLIQVQTETQAGPPGEPDTRSQLTMVMVKDPTESMVVCPFSAFQAIDLSTSNDGLCLLMPGEKTPHSRSAAKVCLEKGFNPMCADTTRQPDVQSTVLSNLGTIFQQSAEAQEAVIQLEKQKRKKTDRENPFDISSSCVGGVFDPITNSCGQHQGLLIPMDFALHFHQERVVAKALYASSMTPVDENVVAPAASRSQSNIHVSLPTETAKAAPHSDGESQSSGRKRARPCMSVSQRRERHNSMERERRKKIRQFCDELNTMVPFCNSDTDKVTTLQWTTAFLRYINKMHGDAFKEEFRVFSHEKGLCSGQNCILEDMDDTPSIHLGVEQ